MEMRVKESYFYTLIFLDLQEHDLVTYRFGKIIKGQKKDIVKFHSVFLSLLWFGFSATFYKFIWHLLTLILKF